MKTGVDMLLEWETYEDMSELDEMQVVEVEQILNVRLPEYYRTLQMTMHCAHPKDPRWGFYNVPKDIINEPVYVGGMDALVSTESQAGMLESYNRMRTSRLDDLL